MKLKIIGLIGLTVFTAFLGVEILANSNNPNNSSVLECYEKPIITDKNCKDTNVQNNSVQDKNVYGTMSMSKNWVIDPTDTKKILTELDNIFLIKAKVNSVGKPLFLNTTENNSNPYPVTPVNISLSEVFLGKNIDKLEEIYLTGGKVTIAQTMKTMSKDDIAKLEYDKLPSDSLDSNYIDYISDSDYKLNPSNEYVFVLAKQKDNTYQILGNGYGVFKQGNIQSKPYSSTENDLLIYENKINYKNVLSEKDLILPDNKSLK